MDGEFNFANPAEKYGEVAFFWWQGDDVTKEKLKWILNQLKDSHICGLQINYCHGNRGGYLYGLTMESNPRPLSDEWWLLVKWFVEECRKYGISVSLSDYTLGAPGQQFFMDWVLEKHPCMIGQKLVMENHQVKIIKVPDSANPIYPGIGDAIIEEFYGAFEKHFPGECGKGINYFFSDELNFNISGNLWTDDFAEQFLKRKNYDITQRWNGIFEDIGPETPKIRMDYYDVIVQLSEERYFKVIYNWHEDRGMTFGCDHGGRGKDVTEFGDYFRAMRWYQGPGNDQPGLDSDIIKSKVSASVAHLYKRPRVWLEGFYGSGWDTGCEDVADAVFRNFALGHNLLSLHGLYYSTHGSMWEWAPPCNHHHMPYWKVMHKFLECSKRLSCFNANGSHRCDVAVVYPVAAVEADPVRGKKAVETAFDTAQYLYSQGVDFDFIDFESIERAEIIDVKLCVAEEMYRCVVIPSMESIRYRMTEKLFAFQKAGGIVIFEGNLPVESDRAGREDDVFDALIHSMAKEAFHAAHKQEVLEIMDAKYLRDFTVHTENPFFTHRIIDGKDYYMVYRVPRGSHMTFRVSGNPVILNPWNGSRTRLDNYEKTVYCVDGKKQEAVEMDMPLTEREVFLVMFDTDEKAVANLPAFMPGPSPQDIVLQMEGTWECEIIPTMDNTYGDWRLPASNDFIGAEGRELHWCYKDKGQTEVSIYSYGTYFWTIEGCPEEERLISMEAPVGGMKPYRFSMKTGVEGDAGPQNSYHGLKGFITDDFLVMGEKRLTYANSDSVYEGEGPYYFFTTIYAEETQDVFMHSGQYKPDKIWLDHEEVVFGKIRLAKGRHYVLLRYPKGGRTHFIFSRKEKGHEQKSPLAMSWYQNPDILIPDALPEQAGEWCCYHTICPPGTREIKIVTDSCVKAVIQGKEYESANGIFVLDTALSRAEKICFYILQTRGCYDTALLLEPVQFVCEKGLVDTELPLDSQGFAFYSGGIRYSKEFNIPKLSHRVYLQGKKELGCGMEVMVNGKAAGFMLAEPYSCEITQYVTQGVNKIEVTAYSTLHNHMKTIPTNYNQSPRYR